MNEVTHFKHVTKLNTTNNQQPTTTERIDDAAFVYIIHGTKQLFFEKNSIYYSEGELIYISEKTTISFQNTPNKEGYYLEIELQLPKTLLFSLFTEEQTGCNTLRPESFFGYNEKIISEMASEKLKTVFRSLQTLLTNNASSDNNAIYEMKRIEILRLILASEQRFITNKLQYDIAASDKDLIKPTWDTIFSDKTLSEIASACGLPLFSFKQQFKKTTGSTPYNWILLHRLMHAQFLLCTTKESIGTIASKCCFNAESHFTKLFKREFGVTPSNYRKKTLVAMENLAATEE